MFLDMQKLYKIQISLLATSSTVLLKHTHLRFVYSYFHTTLAELTISAETLYRHNGF